jgi:hypothetical protein
VSINPEETLCTYLREMDEDPGRGSLGGAVWSRQNVVLFSSVLFSVPVVVNLTNHITPCPCQTAILLPPLSCTDAPDSRQWIAQKLAQLQAVNVASPRGPTKENDDAATGRKSENNPGEERKKKTAAHLWLQRNEEGKGKRKEMGRREEGEEKEHGSDRGEEGGSERVSEEEQL